EVINVGGLKFMAAEVERGALTFPNVSLVKATPRSNPITGQHVELSVQANSSNDIDISSIKKFMREQLPVHMMPKRIIIEEVEVGHRYKRT
ncbi:uncharacterized protein METZ01_LOCUS474547, partial [marine metagenome]